MNGGSPARTQRIVITGGSGFIGRALIPALLKAGCDEILSISLSSAGAVPGAKSAQCDLAGDPARISELLQRGDVVVHLAWAGVSKMMDKGKEDADVNERMTENLLSACVAKRASRIIFLSSGGTVYGDWKRAPFKESDPCEPRSAYGKTKLEVERMIERACAASQIPLTIIRLANLYGRPVDGAVARWAVDAFIANAKRGAPLVVNGDGSAVRDYIHMDDAMAFLVRAVMDQSISGTYNIGTGVDTSLAEIISMIESVAGKSLAVSYGPRKEGDLAYNVLDISKAQAAGWSPRWKIGDGIRALYGDGKI